MNTFCIYGVLGGVIGASINVFFKGTASFIALFVVCVGALAFTKVEIDLADGAK